MTTWSREEAQASFNIQAWGQGYFEVNEKGHLAVKPNGPTGPSIDIMDVVEDIREKKLGLPCVVRFQDILRAQVTSLNQVFSEAIKKNEYPKSYWGVYPIKVNQMREVVEEVLDAGQSYHHGLEAGSKAELVGVLGMLRDPKALLICNGYKDREYIRLALLGRKVGLNLVIVIEQFSELEMILEMTREMDVDVQLGVRAKLAARGIGKWQSSSGDFAKFGLTVPEIIQVCQRLENDQCKHFLKLFHFHVGSQLTDIRTIKAAVTEGTRIYAKLLRMGFPVEYLDIGGGLGVDYEGTRTTEESSMNYTLEEYASDVVYNIQEICRDEEVEVPHIVSESGRAIVAHHSCIIMDVFGNLAYGNNNNHIPETNEEIASEFRHMLLNINEKNALETYHDAVQQKQEALDMFRLGYLDLNERAIVENLYWQVCKSLVDLSYKMEKVPSEILDLRESLFSQYYANFSLFQSAPDHWAFKQLFPLVPLHRLNERPSLRTKVVDLTCDSDGKIEKFIQGGEVSDHVILHEYDGSPYFIGMFLMGAYQEIMGDMHNLFGRVNEIHVFVDDDDPEDFYIEEVIRGDSVSDILSRLQYSKSDLIKKIKLDLERTVREGKLKPKEGVLYHDFYADVLDGYTYLKSE